MPCRMRWFSSSILEFLPQVLRLMPSASRPWSDSYSLPSIQIYDIFVISFKDWPDPGWDLYRGDVGWAQALKECSDIVRGDHRPLIGWPPFSAVWNWAMPNSCAVAFQKPLEPGSNPASWIGSSWFKLLR